MGLLEISSQNLSHAATQVRTGITDNRDALATRAVSSTGIVLELLSGLALAAFCSPCRGPVVPWNTPNTGGK